MRLDKAQLQIWYDKSEKWWEHHPHRERLYLLIFIWAAILLFWYAFFEKPYTDNQKDISSKIVAQNKQIEEFNKEIAHATAQGNKIVAEQKAIAEQKKLLPAIDYASDKDNERIIQTILAPKDNVKFISLKTQPTESKTLANQSTVVTKNHVEISFVSNYFDTMAYLAELEKLPWCLTWDSLDYKVNTYPEAQVSINLHIVNS